MAFLKLLLSGGLLFIVIVNVTAKRFLHFRLQKNIIPQHYSIKLIPYIDESDIPRDLDSVNYTCEFKSYYKEHLAKGHSIFFGTVKISILITHETDEICLHALNLAVHPSIKLLPDENTNLKQDTLLKKYFYDDNAQAIILTFYKKLVPQRYSVHIKFLGALTDYSDSFARISSMTEFDDKTWAAVAGNFPPLGVRQLFPCFDEPGFKSTFDISIKHRKKYLVLTNTQFKKIETLDKTELDLKNKDIDKDKYQYYYDEEFTNQYKDIDEHERNNTSDNVVYEYEDEDADKDVQKDEDKGKEEDEEEDEDKEDKLWTQFDNEREMVWSHFTRISPISTYQVAIVISNSLVRLSQIHFNLWCRLKIAQLTIYALDIVNNVTEYLYSELNDYGLNYKNKNLIIDHVAIPGFRNKGMDNEKLIFYSETGILFDQKLDPIAQKIEVVRLIGYKMVQYLIGNKNCISWWSDVWISEGIATFFGTYVMDKIEPNLRLMDLFLVQVQHEALRLNAYYKMPLKWKGIIMPPDIDSVISYPRYVKAPIPLRILLQLADLYKLDYKRIFYKYLEIQYMWYEKECSGYTLNSAKNLWNAINAITKIFNVSRGHRKHPHLFNITKKMKCWAKQKVYPVLTVRQNCAAGKITIEELRNNSKIISNISTFSKLPKTRCWIPVNYVKYNNISVDTQFQWLESMNPKIHIDTSPTNCDWIIINSGQIGYYRVKYDNNNLREIAKYLNKESYMDVHVLNRAQIIDDAFYFLTKKQLSFSLFEHLTKYLVQETDYVAWYPMIKAIEYFSSFFPFKESEVVKKHMRHILNKVLNTIKYVKPANEYSTNLMSSLREEAVRWACTLGSKRCKRNAARIFNRHMANVNEAKETPAWTNWIYCTGSISANNTNWYKIVYIWQKRSDQRFLEFLACTNNTDIIKNYLQIITTEFEFVKYNAINNITYIKSFYSVIARHSKSDDILKYILLHFNEIKPRNINIPAALVYIINHLYTNEQLDMVKQFVITNVDIFIQRGLILNIQSKINLRSKQTFNLKQQLKNLLKK